MTNFGTFLLFLFVKNHSLHYDIYSSSQGATYTAVQCTYTNSKIL